MHSIHHGIRQVERLLENIRAVPAGPWPVSKSLKPQLQRSTFQPCHVQNFAQADAGPQRVTHRRHSPLARPAREAAGGAAIAGALVDGGDGKPF